LPDSVPPTSGADAATSAPTIYCPYADKEIPLGDSNPEHIIPLAVGGLNSFTLPVSKDFNSRIGSEIDGALANDFLVMSQRDKHGVRGHSRKHPEVVIRNASTPRPVNRSRLRWANGEVCVSGRRERRAT
jgi:hypothetical protein